MSGDWLGALAAAASAVGAMMLVSLVGAALLEVYEAGARAVLVATTMTVAASFGGDLTARGAASSFEAAGSSSVGVLPLTVTIVGMVVLAVAFLRRPSVRNASTARDGLLQATRTAVLLAALALIVALLSRYRTSELAGALGGEVSLGASVPSTVVGALLLGLTIPAAALFAARTQLMPARVRNARERLLAPVVATGALLALGVLPVLAGLVYGLVTGDEQLAQLGLVLLFLPNLAVAAVLLTMGVPLRSEGGLLGELGPGIDTDFDGTITLLTLTDEQIWWWLAPLVLAVALLVLTLVLMLRQNTLPDARREGYRFVGALAVVTAVAAILIRVSGELSGELSGALSGVIGGAEAHVSFNPVVTFLVAGIWAAVAAVVVPQLAPYTPPAFAQAVRRRLGVAPPATETAPDAPPVPRPAPTDDAP